jgi:hypothetical protein
MRAASASLPIPISPPKTAAVQQCSRRLWYRNLEAEDRREKAEAIGARGISAMMDKSQYQNRALPPSDRKIPASELCHGVVQYFDPERGLGKIERDTDATNRQDRMTAMTC